MCGDYKQLLIPGIKCQLRNGETFKHHFNLLKELIEQYISFAIWWLIILSTVDPHYLKIPRL